MIKAIETSYKGYRFRSRLEARWAVFFDALGIEWEYEKEGYWIGRPEHEDGCAYETPPWGRECDCSPTQIVYLPDFYLKDTETWVEVKGDWKQFDLQTLADAVDWGAGLPGTDQSAGTKRGLLLLGSIPEARNMFYPVHPILQHSKGGWVNFARFSSAEILDVSEDQDAYFDSTWGQGYDDLEKLLEKYWSDSYGYTDMLCDQKIMSAYRAARSARFEHGENG